MKDSDKKFDDKLKIEFQEKCDSVSPHVCILAYDLPFDMSPFEESPHTFKSVPKTGVIYVVSRAAEMGFTYDNPEWANFGQGAPETGVIPDSPPKTESISLTNHQQEYSPVAGLTSLRAKVADLYNEMYRKNRESKYTWKNVAICGGGRLALTRIAASLGDINIGHFLPDYTAYEELLNSFKSFHPIPILLDEKKGYAFDADDLYNEIVGRGLGALLISNPCNPTGKHIRGDELRDWVTVCRQQDCAAIFDEFYSHYTYGYQSADSFDCVSAAEHVEDVNTDPILIVDGLTKNWRYPGWRISWTVGPESIIEKIASAGSYLDGGAPHPLQHAAVSILDTRSTMRETAAIQHHFSKKRDFMLNELFAMGIKVSLAPEGTFYCWADLSDLPEGLNDGFSFFEEGLKHKVITVPGVFFDINPGKRRSQRSRYSNHIRVSFGPDMETLKMGTEKLSRMIREFPSQPLRS